jgi:hypothetical protein
MAPRRKKRTTHNLTAAPITTGAPSLGQPALLLRDFKLRLPQALSERIEHKAARERRSQNATIIDELTRFPDLEKSLEKARDFGEGIEDMKATLARYSARIVAADLKDDLLRALRDVLRADEADNIGELRAKLARIRVILGDLEKVQAAGR